LSPSSMCKLMVGVSRLKAKCPKKSGEVEKRPGKRKQLKKGESFWESKIRRGKVVKRERAMNLRKKENPYVEALRKDEKANIWVPPGRKKI